MQDPTPLDYETRHDMRLIVMARDGNHYAYATLLVRLEDVNDNYPKFSQDVYVSAIWENNEPETFITQVRIPLKLCSNIN